jgi:hypothetical protein
MADQKWTPETEAEDRAWCKANNRIWTPWGPADSIDIVARGIISYGTECHGGFFLSPDRNAKVHPVLRNDEGWYEEDCEWSKVVYTFPKYFSEGERDAAEKTLISERTRTVMTPINPRWHEFCDKLAGDNYRCNGCLRFENGTLNPDSFAVQILSEMGNLDIESSIAFFERHGGFCDCEILLNVQDSLKKPGETEGWMPFSELQPQYTMTCIHCGEKVPDLNCCENCGWSKHVLTPTKSRGAKYPFKSVKCGGPMEPTARDEDGDPTAWKCLICGEEHRNP